MDQNRFKVFIRTCRSGDIPKGVFNFRLRIIYPNGKAEYSYASSDPYLEKYGFEKNAPCWYECGMTEKESIEAMRQYDKCRGYKTKLLFEMK